MNRFHSATCALVIAAIPVLSQQRTFCNPINIDYGYAAIPGAIEKGKHRSTADPVIVLHKNTYYLFSTNQYGYWWGKDLITWTFVPRLFLKPYHTVMDELCAPAAVSLGDTLLLIGSANTPDFPLWMSGDARRDNWSEAVDSFKLSAWDPGFFLDDDGRLYAYWGSSNVYPIYGQEIDRKTFRSIGERKELLRLHDDIHGWERFGEANDNTFLRPFIEGAWMNKHNGRYYLQYGAPGTEFSGYSDGVYVGDRPLGPFTYQPHNPFSSKLGGFARGAGHGGTFQDKQGNWWHTATIMISVKNTFERRIGLWPAGFDEDDVMWCNTAYGDYPMYVSPSAKRGAQEEKNGSQSTDTSRPTEAPGTSRLASGGLQAFHAGWMLLNYSKPVSVSSTLGGYAPNFAVDEDIRTYWSAGSADEGEWIQSDLGSVSTVRAIQVNYADQGATIAGRQPGLYHRYIISASVDGLDWTTIIDKSTNTTDVPHDYVELARPADARFIRLENKHVPTGMFALSGLRVFGNGHGEVPDTVSRFIALRGESERRNVVFQWEQSDNATGYVIYLGVEPGKLYTSVMVYGANQFVYRGMSRDETYYARIEAFNESGSGSKSEVIRIK